VRCYGINDQFKDTIPHGARFCGRPLLEWIALVGITPDEVWPGHQDAAERAASGYRRWLWMYQPETAGAAEKRAFISAERYSAVEIAVLADQEAFHQRRIEIRAEQ